MGVDDLAVGGFANDSEIEFRARLGIVLRSLISSFFAHQSDKSDLERSATVGFVDEGGEGGDHGGDGTFGVRRTSAVKEIIFK